MNENLDLIQAELLGSQGLLSSSLYPLLNKETVTSEAPLGILREVDAKTELDT